MNRATIDASCPGCFAPGAGSGPCPECGYGPSTPRPPSALPIGSTLNGQFLVGRVLGKPGGFGITYLGLDLQLETRVAIKEYLPRDLAVRNTDGASVVPHSSEDGELFRYGLGQFLAEARILAQLDHPNIVRIRQFFQANGSAYLVMDYYQGLTLAEHLARLPAGRMPESQAMALIHPVLDGLRAVHAKGFLHRDIKPANIYLARTDRQGVRPILLDFGAARQAMGERSRSLSVVLSEGYAPFEQYRRRGDQGPWTDVYSAAAVLYRMLSGEDPPSAPDRISRDELSPASLPGISPALADALLAALALDREQRPSTVEAFQAVLARPFGDDRREGPGSQPARPATPSGPGQLPEPDRETRTDPVEPPPGYVAAGLLARDRGIPEGKVIAMIRDGFYDGITRDGHWFVHANELGDAGATRAFRTPGAGESPSKQDSYVPIEALARAKGIPTAKAIAMVRDGFYDGRLVDGAWQVAASELAATSGSRAGPGHPGADSSNGLRRLMRGEFGLAETFWVYGLLVLLPIAILWLAGLWLASMALLVYLPMVMVGIWRAADRFAGPRVWRVLARLYVALGSLALTAVAVELIVRLTG